MKGLLSNFHLNGHTLGFHPQTQKLEPACTAQQTVPPTANCCSEDFIMIIQQNNQYQFISFRLNGDTLKN